MFAASSDKSTARINGGIKMLVCYMLVVILFLKSVFEFEKFNFKSVVFYLVQVGVC